MIADLGPRAVSIVEDEPSAAYATANSPTFDLVPRVELSAGCRALVELRRFHGGTAPRVVVGGAYEPSGDTLTLVVGEQASPSRRRTCRAALGSRRLFPGLPAEFVEPVFGGLFRTLNLGPGVITIDRFGFDPVETSPLVTELAAELLGRVMSLGAQPTEQQAFEWLRALP